MTWLLFLIVGFLIGMFVRGCIAKTRIARLKNEHQEQKVITEIERERVKQDRLLSERMR